MAGKNKIKQPTAADANELLRLCVDALGEKKSEQTIALNLSEISSCFDYFIITNGSSQIHCRALAKDVMRRMSEQGRTARSKPDLDSSWIVLDYDDIVLHVFTEDTRAYYQLEKLWGDAARVLF
ncbi:MAG: ribosome silencing factor [Leptospirales bacterium]|nr:ribosome silencing factor [Leptospirales bacterium]